jgi:hypothetical protein
MFYAEMRKVAVLFGYTPKNFCSSPEQSMYTLMRGMSASPARPYGRAGCAPATPLLAPVAGSTGSDAAPSFVGLVLGSTHRAPEAARIELGGAAPFMATAR